MKRFLLIISLVIGSTMFSSCEQPTILSISQTALSFENKGGDQSVTLTSNKLWTASSNQGWLRVSPSSGEGNASISVSCEANPTYDSRTGTITIISEEMSQTITITQAEALGLIVSQKEFNISNDAQTISVEVLTNVQFTVRVDDACNNWIKQETTKALPSNIIKFAISSNEEYVGREGRITIKQIDGSLSETIVVNQSQTDGLFITTPEYNLSNESHTLSVEVQANVSFEVTPEAEWIHYVQTKALNSSTITLTIDANDTYDARTGKVSVKQTNGSLKGIITVNQAEKFGLFVSLEEFNLTKDKQTINVEVKCNVEYDVVISDAAKEWVSIQTAPSTKGLTTETLSFAIAENKSYVSRETAIAFKQKGGDLMGTVKITQDQTDYLSITPQKDSIVYSGGGVDLSIITNVEYDVSLDDACTWVSIGEGEKTGTKDGLTTFVYSVSTPENGEIVARYASIQVRSTSADIVASFVLAQGPQPTITFADKIVEKVCVKKFDSNSDGYITYKEANAVEIMESNFFGEYAQAVSSFMELQFFKNVKKLCPAFCKDCSHLLNIKLPKALHTIGESSFYGCTLLQKIDLPATAINIDYSAFALCESIESITLPEGLTKISDYLFSGCKSLKSVIIPSSVKAIGRNSFMGCDSIDLTIPETITNLDVESFWSCNGIIRFADNTSITIIPEQAFQYCDGLHTMVLPKGIVAIRAGGFMNCRNIESIYLPETLLSISNRAFAFDPSLTSFYSSAPTAPFIEKNTFESINPKAVLYVPKGCSENYQSWVSFFGGGVVEVDF